MVTEKVQHLRVLQSKVFFVFFVCVFVGVGNGKYSILTVSWDLIVANFFASYIL